MGFRLRRSVRLFPGVRLNVSKSGLSTSFGTRGAWLTVGKRGTRATIGLPGTGISYTTMSSSRSHPHRDAEPDPEPAPLTPGEMQASEVRGWFWLALILAGLVWIVRHFITG